MDKKFKRIEGIIFGCLLIAWLMSLVFVEAPFLLSPYITTTTSILWNGNLFLLIITTMTLIYTTYLVFKLTL